MSTSIDQFSNMVRAGMSRTLPHVLQRLSSWQLGRLISTMQGKLVLTSLLVSVLPMILVAEITSNIIVDRIHSNLETMLLEVSSYFLSAVKESQDETGSVIDFLATQPNWISSSTDQIYVNPPVKSLLKGLGFDTIAIVDKNLNVTSSYPEGLEIRSVAFAGVSNLYAVQYQGHLTMMSGAIREEKIGNKSVSVFMGSWIDADFISAARAVKSVEIQLYYLKDGAFRQVFSSQTPYTEQILPPEIVTRIQKNKEPVLVKAKGFGFGNILYRGVTASDGETIAVLSTRLVSPIAVESWVDHGNLFIGIFIIGLLLSAIVGLLVSRRMAVPLRNLAIATQKISTGDYSQVAVKGDDEVANLSRAFNRMASDLKEMRALEEELQRRERIATLGEVSIGIAHEVRNPLGTIKTSAELVRRRGGLRVLRISRPRYGCRACGTIHQAPAPERPITKGLATSDLLAHVLISKYCDHLPLYRQSQIFARQGLEINRSTLANWVGGAAWWLEPLRARLAEQVFASKTLCLKDTVCRRHTDPGT